MRLKIIPRRGVANVNSNIAERTERVSKLKGTKDPRLSERNGGITTDRTVVVIPITPVSIDRKRNMSRTDSLDTVTQDAGIIRSSMGRLVLPWRKV